MTDQQSLPGVPAPLEVEQGVDFLKVNGVKYSADLFRGLADWPLDQRLRIVKREDGVVTLERLDRKSIPQRASRKTA